VIPLQDVFNAYSGV